MWERVSSAGGDGASWKNQQIQDEEHGRGDREPAAEQQLAGPSRADSESGRGRREGEGRTRRRYACTMTSGFDAFMEKRKLW